MTAAEKPGVLVTRPIFPEVVERLSAGARVEVQPEDRCPGPEELRGLVRGMRGLLSFVTDRVDAPVMDAAPGLRVIGNCAVGFDNVDLAEATRRGIQVSNTPGVLTEATADLAWALLLAVARGVVPADRHVREGRFRGWGPMDFLGRDLCGETLGILGMGRIGQAVARRAAGFGMRVLFTTRSPWTGSPGFPRAAAPAPEPAPRAVPLDTLLRESDFLSVHVPLTPATVRMIGRRELALMKPTAVLINTSRGRVVDEQALVEALREGTIGGAGLDVYEREPELAPGLAELPNAVLLPHIGSASVGTRRKMAMTAAENILCGLRGERVPDLVNTDVAPR